MFFFEQEEKIIVEIIKWKKKHFSFTIVFVVFYTLIEIIMYNLKKNQTKYIKKNLWLIKIFIKKYT